MRPGRIAPGLPRGARQAGLALALALAGIPPARAARPASAPAAVAAPGPAASAGGSLGAAGPAAAEPGSMPRPRLRRIEPPRDAGAQLGDLVEHRLLVEWPAGWALDRDGLPEAARADRAVELHSHRLEPAAGVPGCDCRWLVLRWQILKSPRLVEDLQLPAFTVRLRRDAALAHLDVPAWRVAVAAQVPWDARRDWLGSQRPGWQAQPFEPGARLAEAGGFALLAALAAGAWAWRQGRLPGRAGRRPFAQAWRALRRSPGAAALPPEPEAWQHWHRAFDAHSGRVVFHDDLAAWLEARPAAAALGPALQAAFEASRRHFFGGPAPAGGAGFRRAELVRLLGALAALEGAGGLGPARAGRPPEVRHAG